MEKEWIVLDWWYADNKIEVLIEGGATGVDAYASSWAIAHGVPRATYYAEWSKFERGAGPLRNQRMALRNQRMVDDGKPDAALAFPGGAGTADMVRRALNRDVPVYAVAPITTARHKTRKDGDPWTRVRRSARSVKGGSGSAEGERQTQLFRSTPARTKKT